MATQLQIRRGTTAQMNAFTGAEGELAVNTTTDTLHVHDGATAGGKALARADGSNIATYAGSFTTIAASGAITGNVTGNLTGSILTAAQTNITSVGTLSTLAVTGEITANGGIALPDDGVLSLGDSDELTLKHHSSGYSHLINTTGTLFVDSDSVTFRDDDGSPSNMVISQTGIDVTGSVTADGFVNNGDVVFSKSSTGVPTIKMSGFAGANSPYGVINFYNEDGSQQGPNNAAQIKALAKNSDGSGGEFAFYTSTGTSSEGADATERLRITGAGQTQVVGFDAMTLGFPAVSGGASRSGIKPTITGAGSGQLQFLVGGDNNNEATTIAAMLDASGNLLVGTTSNSVYNDASGTGIALNAGQIQIAGTGTPLYANRQGSDGDIIDFRKDGSTVGSIGTKSSLLTIGTGTTGLIFDATQIYPWNTNTNAAIDASKDLGASGARFKDLYLSGGAYLGGTAAANKLDSYETGTWTPTFHAYTGNLPSTFSTTNSGQYTKVGRMVSLIGYLQINSISGASSNIINIRGLPFSPIVGNSYHPSGSMAVSNMNFARTTHSSITTFNATDLGFLTSNGNANWTWELFTIFKTSSYMRFEITYYTAS